MQEMFLLFLGDFDLLIPLLNDASAYMLSVWDLGKKMHFLDKKKTCF